MRLTVVAGVLFLFWPSLGIAGEQELRNLALYQELSDDEIAKLFYDTVLGSEDPTVGKLRAGTARKYAGVIEYFVAGRGKGRFAPLDLMLSELPSLMPVVPIRPADGLNDANFRIFLVSNKDEMIEKIRDIWGSKISAKQQEFMKKQDCIFLLDYYGKSSRIRRSTIIIPLTSSHPECAFEEFVQGLGPINDSSLSTKTAMNDRSDFAQMPLADLYVANMLYDPRIKPGMTKDEITKILPSILSSTKKSLMQLTKVLRQ
jgi:hypothetical protein